MIQRFVKACTSFKIADVVSRLGLVLFCLLPFVVQASDQAQDTLFKKAEEIKARLVAVGDTSTAERIALNNEFVRVCEIASKLDVESYTKALRRCESLVRDISHSYEFLELIRDSAEKWQNEERKVKELVQVNMVLARICAGLQDHKGAYSYLEVIETLPLDSLSPVLVGNYYFFKGYLAYYAGEIEKAVSYLAPASEWSLKGDDQRLKMISHNALAHCHNLQGNFKDGFEVASIALSILDISADTTAWTAVLASLYINLAEAQHGIGEKQTSYRTVSDALYLANKSNFRVIIGNVNWVWSRLLRRDNRLEEAKRKAKIALAEYAGEKDPHSMLLAYDELIKSTKAMSDFESSLHYSEAYHQLKDSLNSAKLFIESHSSQLIRESERQQAELALLREKTARHQAEVNRQKIERLAWIGMAVLFGLLSFLIYTRLRSKKIIQSKLESEVARRTEALQIQAQRLKTTNEELERFAFIASHDLKTPIRNIVSFLNLIERKLLKISEPQLLEFIRIASDNARHMHELISGVLEFSKLNAETESICESVDLAAEIDQLKSALVTDEINFEVKGDSIVHAPKVLINQLFRNIIENGLKYNTSQEKELTITIEQQDDLTVCKVKDNGIGIQPEYQEKIFGLFKRLHTNDQYEGTGLGLALCKKITDRIGGRITVDSAPGKGSTFTISIPQNCADNIENYKRYKESLAGLN